LSVLFGQMKREKSIYSRQSQALGKVLREARNKAGLSLREFEDEYGWSKSTLSEIECGQRRLDVIEFIQLCKILKLDASKVIKKLST